MSRACKDLDADAENVTGRRIVELQTSLALVHGTSAAAVLENFTPDQYGREPFRHPALDRLQGLTEQSKSMIVDKRRIAQLAGKYGLDGVLRWKPKRVGSW